jgi:hypothetical protein
VVARVHNFKTQQSIADPRDGSKLFCNISFQIITNELRNRIYEQRIKNILPFLRDLHFSCQLAQLIAKTQIVSSPYQKFDLRDYVNKIKSI